MLSNQTYQAAVIGKKLEGENLPSIEEIVRDILLNSDIELKKEEIDEAVRIEMSKKIGFQLPLDDSLIGATSAALKKLQSQNIIKHSSHGYWKKY